MIYPVGEMAQKLGVPASTLRYYDKEGLLPFVERSSGGIRMSRSGSVPSGRSCGGRAKNKKQPQNAIPAAHLAAAAGSDVGMGKPFFSAQAVALAYLIFKSFTLFPFFFQTLDLNSVYITDLIERFYHVTL